MKASVSNDLRHIDTSLASLRRVLLNLTRINGESAQDTVGLCDAPVENVMGEFIRTVLKHLSEYTDLRDIQAVDGLARETAAGLVRLHKRWRDIDSHAGQATVYAEESVDAGSDSGTEGEAFLTSQSGAKGRDSSTAQADTADGSIGSVLGGNMSWSVEFTM
ncbi:putative Glutamic acid alanine rich protein of Trypanosoma [Trypanosoma vivax]|nr:hypothetical protein TRVL_09711 [Trypanosoma vivax]KAH8608369.1 putative Glutamic acid alanine rich protein of Trypanosoma [Trypanosoma vivax]